MADQKTTINRQRDNAGYLQKSASLIGLDVMDEALVTRHFKDGAITPAKLDLTGGTVALLDRAVTVEETITNSAYEIDSTEARVFDLTMSNDITFSISGDGVTDSFVVVLTQDGVGNRTPSWDGGISWGDAGEPEVSAAAGEATVLVFMYYRSKWLGFSSGTGF